MNGSRNHPRHGDTSSLDALSRTIEGLEARIEGLMGAPARADSRPRPPQADYGQRPEQPAARYREPAAERDVRPDPLAEIRQRQRLLDSSRDRPLQQVRAETRQDVRPSEHRPQEQRRTTTRETYAQPEQRRQPSMAAQPQAAAADHQMKEIAQALVSLRQELKRDISEGVSREVGALRSEMRNIKASAQDQHFAADVRDDLARLAQSIDQLGGQGAPHREIVGLQTEFQDLRVLLDGLAREDSVRRMETRWHGVEDRLQALDPVPLQEELVSLAYRLDDIKSHLGNMSHDPAIRVLEDKMISIASALETLGDRMQPNDRAIAEQFAGLDLRLDEISRAIVAGNRSANAFDPSLVQRLEGRLNALAEQIDDIGRAAINRPDPAAAFGARIEALTARVEEFANVEAASRLEERLDQLSMLLERSQKAPAASELTGYLSDISRKIDALDQGSVNDVLAERLDYLARRIDDMEFHPQPAPVPLMDDDAFRRIEGQLLDIATRLDETTAAPASDNRALKALEDQIAHLSLLISEPRQDSLSPAVESRMAALEDYMATSDEYIIEAARQAAEAVVEAYSRNGMTSSAAAPADMSALTALAHDLRNLEDLTRHSESRTQQTFEALHDTLVQIAGRLETMDDRFRSLEDRSFERRPEPVMPKAAQPVFAEPVYEETARPFGGKSGLDDFDGLDTGLSAYPHRDVQPSTDGQSSPVIRTMPQEEVDADIVQAMETVTIEKAMPSKGSLLVSLGKRLLGRKPAPVVAERATIEPTPPLAPEDIIPADDANELLEPGSGAPDVKKILERVRASQNGQRVAATPEVDRADYIAAARRAAQAAAQEVDQAQQRLNAGKGGAGFSAKFSQHRRPILMAVGAILLALMAVPLVNTLVRGEKAPVAVETTTKSTPSVTTGADPAAATADNKSSASATQATEANPGNSTATDTLPTDTKAIPADTGAENAPLNATASATSELPVAGDSIEEPSTAATAGAEPAQETAIVVPDAITPKSLSDAAVNGDPAALFEIGARYTEGRGVAVDLAEAAKWYQRAADKGFAPAQYRIANLYEKGTGVERDLAKAKSYYQQAADKGNASAMHNLAVLLATGVEGKPDFDAAVSWFVKAADLGVADSQFNLAILYARGNGVKQDLEQSYKWFAIAAKDGDKDAAQKRDEVANAMRPEQLENARAQVDLWKPQPLNADANSVNIPDEWVGKGVKTASVDMKKAVRNIQAILNNNGFDAGTPDGEMGKKTVNAIKAFQKSIGHEPDGKITDALVKELLARNK
ncbi:peptidoglycan-binding protein [Rhizobium sp. LjRoot30]|uniref:peptidoglycan-binding protein n=1 Tax=Rhizobium sp. LjRoot30 TaxID=3342320 RepID=UPI003ECC1D32